MMDQFTNSINDPFLGTRRGTEVKGKEKIYADVMSKRNKLRCLKIMRVILKNGVLIAICIGLTYGVIKFDSDAWNLRPYMLAESLPQFNFRLLNVMWQALALKTLAKVLEHNMGVRFRTLCLDRLWNILLILLRLAIIVSFVGWIFPNLGLSVFQSFMMLSTGGDLCHANIETID
jgi:hypothetical protein